MEPRFQRHQLGLAKSIVVILALATAAKVWVEPPAWIAPANAQIPDSGLQRKELLDEARHTNELLAEIRQLLKEHTFNVRLQGADKQSPPATKSGDGGL